MTIPILEDHDHSKPPIGYLYVDKNILRFRFNRGVTRAVLFDTLGNIGVTLTEMELRNDDELIYAGEVFCWSVSRALTYVSGCMEAKDNVYCNKELGHKGEHVFPPPDRCAQ